MVSGGYVSQTCHPTLPLRIYNYTQNAQHERVWNPVTNLCRGLIVDDQDVVISRAFNKFHNLGTEYVSETLLENLPKELPSITKKLDGSLGIYWEYDSVKVSNPAGQTIRGIATRGSFISEQAQWATVHAHRNLNMKYWEWPEDYTPLFEIVFKQNRIVVEYNWEDIVLLALVNIETGEELPRHLMEDWGNANGTKIVSKSFYNQLKDITILNIPNEEGYVLTWDNPGKPPLKVKVKFEDYVKLHRIVTGMNPKTIWEMLSSGQEEEIKKLLSDNSYPNGFRLWLHNWYLQLMGNFNDLKDSAFREYDRIIGYSGEGSRKDYAVKINQCGFPQLLFGLLDGKDIDQMVWKILKPRGDDKTYRIAE
jgi:RNA ligase